MPKIFEYLGILLYFYSNEHALKGKDLKYFEEFLEIYASKIVEKWIDYFVYHKDVELEKIKKRIK